MTEKEELELRIREQIELEKVAPKFEEWRNHYRYKLARGGRGAGAKSHSMASLLVQAAHIGLKGPRDGYWLKPPVKILCLREIQLSLEESSYALIRQKIDTLRYPGFNITREAIKHLNGSEFLFRGIKDLRAAQQIKSYEGFDIFAIEEAAAVSLESLQMLLPTLRKPYSELWAVYNRELESDPIDAMLFSNPRPSSCLLDLQPGSIDNPWFNDTPLPMEMEEDYKRDPDGAAHIWGGMPRKQGDYSVMSRVSIRGAMDRKIDEPIGVEEIGVDVARFGNDSTQMYKRHGLKTIKQKEMKKADTIQVAQAVWDFADHRRDMLIKIDEGYNPGVVDTVKSYGANVMAVNFGGAVSNENKDKYTSTADEMWFEFPIDEAEIPNDPDLMTELSDRRYDYEKGTNRKKIESKDEYKKRHNNKSPDKADALLLCYFSPPIQKFELW